MPVSEELSEEICSAIKELVPNVLVIYAFGSQGSGFGNSEWTDLLSEEKFAARNNVLEMMLQPLWIRILRKG
jgi:hypothetical protein